MFRYSPLQNTTFFVSKSKINVNHFVAKHHTAQTVFINEKKIKNPEAYCVNII